MRRRPSFRALTEQLLDAGVAPRFAERLGRELEDHYRDLEREALERGNSAQAAAIEARRRLGREGAIAREFLSRPELKSWVYRWAWFALCLRGLCLVWLGLSGACTALRPARSAIVRFAAAGAAAAILTSGLLLALELAISARTPSAVRTLGPVRTVAVAGIGDSDEPAREAARVYETWPRTIREPDFARPQRPLQDMPAPALRVEPTLAAVEIEMTLAPGVRLTDGDLLGLVKVVPEFPALAARRGLEGYVLIEYTVTRTGSVSDIVVVESSSEVFEQPALDAISKFKYKPRVVDGMAVPVRGVRARMRFLLEA